MTHDDTLTRRQVLIGAAAGMLLTLGAAHATLPELLRIFLPFPPGNLLDASARWLSETYRTVAGRNAVVENKPGAAATIAASEISRAKPDSSMVLFAPAGHLTTSVLMKKVPYDPIEGFTPVTPVAKADGFTMVTKAGSRFNSAHEVLDSAKKAPGKVSYASAGNGNTTRVVGAMFAKNAGVDLLHVPYNGDFLTYLLRGVTDITFIGPAVRKTLPRLREAQGVGHHGNTARPLDSPGLRVVTVRCGKESDAVCRDGAVMGANVRVGLEDSLYIGPGHLAASNAEQVSKIRRILDELGLEVATPDEARERLKLKGRSNVSFV